MMMNDRKVIELEEGWAVIQEGMEKLVNAEQQFTLEECIKLSLTVYNMSIQRPPFNYSRQLYDRHKEYYKVYMDSKVLPALQKKHDEFMLRELVKCWISHKAIMHWLCRIFEYLDPNLVLREALPTLHDVALFCFRDQVYMEMKYNINDAVITLIDRERDGVQIDRALLKNVLGIFVEIGMGEMKEYGDFESYVLQDTAAYYSQKASAWIEEDTCPDYMLKAEECLKREKERVAHYLHASSEQKLLEQVQLKLLSQFEQQLLEKEHSGCRALLRDDKVDDLSRMCRLFSRILQGLQRVANIFRMHVTDEGMTLVKQAEDAASGEKEFVAEVIQLHDKYMHYVNECFSNQPLFHKALKEAFVVFCNKGVSGSTSAELLATFCDNCLKKGGSGKLGDDALEETLEKVVKILAYISDKDLFAEVYRKKLAQRLLFVRSVNDGHERSFLTKLKQQCDGQFTVKMEGMVRDVTLAKELQNSFQGHLSAHPDIHPGIELTATVLMTGNWPSYQSSHLALPSAMVKCVETFRDFYKTKNKNRKLNWIYSLGTCNVLGKFEQKSLELIVTTYQAAVLLLFNSTDGLNYSEIKAHLNLSDQDMVRVLHSLSCAKYKILSKEPNTAIVGTSDLFEFNSMFTDKMSRIKIPFPPMDEKKKIVEDVDKNRRYAIDASIVCIMKSRKALKHQALILECVEQLAKNFKADLKIIKNCIEGLITREFLARDEKDPHTYKYLA